MEKLQEEVKRVKIDLQIEKGKNRELESNLAKCQKQNKDYQGQLDARWTFKFNHWHRVEETNDAELSRKRTLHIATYHSRLLLILPK